MSTRLVAVSILAGLLMVANIAHAQGRLPQNGSELFRFELHRKGLKPLTEHQWKFENQAHKDLLVIVVGDTNCLADFFPGNAILDLVTHGGALLIVSDSSNLRPRANGGALWGNTFGVFLTGTPLSAARGTGYEGRDEKPFIKPRQRVGIESPSPFDMFSGVGMGSPTGIAADRPTEMLTPGAAGFLVKRLADYPENTRNSIGGPITANGNTFAVSVQPVDPVGVARPGRMIVLADSQVFANGMMGFKPDGAGGYDNDNGNWEFAGRTIEWLQGGYPEKRTQCLFIENGEVKDIFAKEVPQQPKPPVPNLPPEVLANWLLNYANTVIPWAEENNLFNRFLEQNLGFSRLVRTFLITVTIVFLIFGLRWLMRSGRKPEPTSTITKSVQEGMLPRGGVLRQRTAAQIEVGNLYEAARRRVRSQFDVLGARPNRDGKMPPLLTANDIPDGPLIHQTIRWLWVIGYGETPTSVSPGDWDRLNALLERMSARAARGDWSFGQEA